MTENESFGLVFGKAGSIKSGTVMNSSTLIWEVQGLSVRYSSSFLFDSCVKCYKKLTVGSFSLGLE
jgi:hypothetical protein